MNSLGVLRCWKNSSGVAFRRGCAIAFGLVGSADISGIVMGGIRLEVEVKTGMAVQTPDQIKFQQMIEKFGGIYILARNVEQACDQLQKVLRTRGIEVSI